MCLLMLVQAGATGSRPAAVSASPSPSAPSCVTRYRVAFVTDVAGLRSAADAAGWQGVHEAMAQQPCLEGDLILSTHPSDYAPNLQAAADRHSDLIIAGSFLLSDAAVVAALANPGTNFVLLDPLVAMSGPSNLAIITLREDQAGFLAGALAGLTTRTSTIAAVYSLEDDHARRYQLAFERGARYVNRAARVLAAYQAPGDGSPYANPAWGAAQARAFLDQGADVIFTTGDLTGQGALSAAAEAGKPCITVGLAPDRSAPGCLVGTVLLHIDRAVAGITTDAAGGRWHGGQRSFGLAEGAIEFSWPSTSPPAPDVQRRLRVIADLLANGTI